MKILIGFLLFFTCISSIQAQTQPAPKICITKMCDGIYANKSEILDLKRILVRSDTLSIKTFTLGSSSSCYWEANCVGNSYSPHALDMLERISTASKLYIRINFVSTSGKGYTYDYIFYVKAQ